jgi:hypothetical protein
MGPSRPTSQEISEEGRPCLAIPAVARAQGAIAGQVTGSSGAVLPGVAVEASSFVLTFESNCQSSLPRLSNLTV